jgi:hypothetical protein
MQHATRDMQHATFISVFSHLSPVSAFISAGFRIYQCRYSQTSSAVTRRYCYTMQCGAYTGPTPVGAPLFPPERAAPKPTGIVACCMLGVACMHYVARCSSLQWSATPSLACRSAA